MEKILYAAALLASCSFIAVIQANPCRTSDLVVHEEAILVSNKSKALAQFY